MHRRLQVVLSLTLVLGWVPFAEAQPRSDTVPVTRSIRPAQTQVSPIAQHRHKRPMQNDCQPLMGFRSCKPRGNSSLYSLSDALRIEATATSRRDAQMMRTDVAACLTFSSDHPRNVSLSVGTRPYSLKRYLTAPAGVSGGNAFAGRVVSLAGPFAKGDRRCTDVTLHTRMRPEKVYVEAMPREFARASCGMENLQCILEPRRALSSRLQR